MTCWVLQLLSDSIGQLHLKTAPRPVGCGSKDWPGGNQAFSAGILGYLLTFINVYMCILYMCISVCVYIERESCLCTFYVIHTFHMYYMRNLWYISSKEHSISIAALRSWGRDPFQGLAVDSLEWPATQLAGTEPWRLHDAERSKRAVWKNGELPKNHRKWQCLQENAEKCPVFAWQSIRNRPRSCFSIPKVVFIDISWNSLWCSGWIKIRTQCAADFGH